MVDTPTGKRLGVQWKPANLNGLSKDTRKLYEIYKTEYEKTQTSGRTLKAALNKEWAGHYPDGKDGKTCSFHVINGAINYAWVNKGDQPEDGETLFPQ